MPLPLAIPAMIAGGTALSGYPNFLAVYIKQVPPTKLQTQKRKS